MHSLSRKGSRHPRWHSDKVVRFRWTEGDTAVTRFSELELLYHRTSLRNTGTYPRGRPKDHKEKYERNTETLPTTLSPATTNRYEVRVAFVAMHTPVLNTIIFIFHHFSSRL
jgi:hypothetical protein